MNQMSKTCISTLLVFSLFCGFQVNANETSVYKHVADASQVPEAVLYALSLTESGITNKKGEFKPWPYTLNWLGNDYRFSDFESACSSLKLILVKSSSVDIGESQLHWKYQKDGVDDPCDYFDSKTALLRTASVLKGCYKKSNNWVKAAGCYHRPAGGELSEIYMKKYAKNLKEVLFGNHHHKEI